MYCCGFCGVTAFGGQSPSEAHFKAVAPVPGMPEPPYSLSNMLLVDRMHAPNGEWWCCKACLDPRVRAQRMQKVVQMSVDYVQKIATAPPMETQLLSVMDVSVNLKERIDCYTRGEFNVKGMLLGTPLVARDVAERDPAAPALCREVEDLLAANKRSNPVHQHFLTLAEKGAPNGHGLPLVPPEAIAHITERAAGRNPTNMGVHADVMPRVFNLVAAVDADPQIAADVLRASAAGRPATFKVGQVTVRGSGEDVDVLTDGRGLPVKRSGAALPDGVMELTVELAVFAALFPMGRGAFSGGDFSEYLRYRMLCGFSAFTLYKPYLMVMYLVRQCSLLQSSCKEGVLERDMKAFKKKNPNSSEEEVVRHAMKHAVPNSIPGTPGWHYRNLQDLLAMVQHHGSMPHIFWTVTEDDISELKWKCITDMEALLKNFCRGFTFMVGGEGPHPA